MIHASSGGKLYVTKTRHYQAAYGTPAVLRLSVIERATALARVGRGESVAAPEHYDGRSTRNMASPCSRACPGRS